MVDTIVPGDLNNATIEMAADDPNANGVVGDDEDSSWAKLQISPNNIGSMEYGNFLVNIYAHSANERTNLSSKYYFAPISLLDHGSAQSFYNNVTIRAQMEFRIELWNDDVKTKVVQWIKDNYDEKVNGNFVQVIPFNQIMLASASSTFRRLYQLPSWTPYGKQKDLRFKVNCANKKNCDELAENMKTNPNQFSDFQLKFRLDSEKSQTKQTIIKLESLLSGRIASQLKQQMKGKEFAFLNAKDAQELLQESATNILIDTFDDSDIASSDSRLEIYKFLQKNLIEPGKKVIKDASDKLWGSVFWNEDNYRPDLTSKTFNDVYKKLDTTQQKKLIDSFKNTNKVSYDGSAAITGVLKAKGKLDTDLSREGSTTKESLDKFLQESKETTQWDGQRFVPKPLSLSRLNLFKLREVQTLQDQSVRVRYSKAVLSVVVNFNQHSDLESTNQIIVMQGRIEGKLKSNKFITKFHN